MQNSLGIFSMGVKIAVFLLVSSIVVFAHATAAQSKHQSTSQATSQSTDILVTIKPLHSLVAGVVGDTGKAELLLSGATSPHDFQLKPSQMKLMQSASIIFYIDDKFETFLSHAFEVLPADVRKVAVVQKANLTLYPYRDSGAWDAHQQDGHAHKAQEESHQSEQADMDMHLWLSPENAKGIIKFVAQELSVWYPQNRHAYETNSTHLIARIDALDAKLKRDLARFRNTSFIVFHDAYQYFERHYELNAVGSIHFKPDSFPPPRHIKAMREKLQQTGAKCVFREPQFEEERRDLIA